ncbi:galactosyldiacylglycerol synthase [Selenomonas sp. oral taxon 920]|uniref:MGDG synthase family glycosyltransferase n=1 Tax=Selenomonas sp. oral taxon 920 TaxID=1884263 RepID=UPI000840D60A|nr:glycosyltransferase [Selenomonas sp. oral taxon 920]AOH47684.1 galactosyldiacylglycerol synthase [Selenomonas sp. oral taxon 920]
MERARILILTASIGSGHTRAAEAIRAALAAHPQAEDVQVDVVDFMAREVSMIHYLMKRIYLTMLRFVPDLYDVFFRIAGKNASGGIVRGAFAQVMMRTVGRMIQAYKPDLVVATHPFPEGAAALWRGRHGGSFALAALLTDYALHAIWLVRGVDLYFVATDAMATAMAARGFDPCAVYATGIPITRTSQLMERQAAQETVGLQGDLPTLLLMGGGLGLGGMDRTLAALETVEQRLAILVAAGHNAALEAHASALARTSRHDIRVFSYTDQIPALMRAADLLITKPGGLTISEAFAAGLPLLLHDPIPGPETENAIYATRCGAAVWLHSGERMAPAVEEILAHRIPEMRRAARDCACEDAAQRVAEILMESLTRRRGAAYGAKKDV